jgi:hypothetical protein
MDHPGFMKPLTSMAKQILGELPYAADAYWYLRQAGRGKPGSFSLDRLEKHAPLWRDEVLASPFLHQKGRRVFIFASLRYWLEHITLLGLALRGLGHDVTLAYLPYAKWFKPVDRFDLRGHNAYTARVFKPLETLLHVLPLLSVKKAGDLPLALDEAVRSNALRDTQYTQQVEDVDPASELYRLRLERDMEAALAALAWMQANRPDTVIVPNGTILEFGTVYQVARFLNIPTVTYEFGEQRQRIWLAQNAEVMRQDTFALWEARQNLSLTAEQSEQMQTLFSARQRGNLRQNFARRWQDVPSEGGEKACVALGLDAQDHHKGRPVILLATNVIGDSLTLGRQVFSDSMTEWLERTVRFFIEAPQAQFVIRIHPGELVTKGPSVADVVLRLLPELGMKQLPEHIHLVTADAPVNTYDIMNIADFGLVYTTTVGLEMAMSGTPVIVVGKTHYRDKGFTLDPDTWEDYFQLLDHILDAPQDYRLTQAQVDQAWNYAYRFFFEYPYPFPWHLVHMWKDLEEWPVRQVLSQEGQLQFGKTFATVAGDPITYHSQGSVRQDRLGASHDR